MKEQPLDVDAVTPASYERTVLLVEDDADVRDMLANQLEAWHYTVISVADGIAAMERLDQKIDLLLADVILPGGMNGIDVAETLEDTWPDMKVILVSGYADAVLAAKDIPKDRYPLLSKPFRTNELRMALEEAFAAIGETPITTPQQT